MKSGSSNILSNVERLMILRDLAMLDAPEEPFFDNLTKLASRVIGVPVSLVSLVAANYQFFKSSEGLPEPWRSNRRTPLSHSFCQHVVTSGKPLIVSDARQHELVKTNRAIPDLNVIGYLGMPLHTSNGHQLGSFCVIDDKPHEWTESEIEVMEAFAKLVNVEIDARVRAKKDGTLRQHIEEAREDILGLMGEISTNTPHKQVIEKLKKLEEEIKAKRKEKQ